MGMSLDELASALVPPNLTTERAAFRRRELRSALKNWEHGLLRPQPRTDDITGLSRALGVEPQNLLVWTASHRYAPIAPRKARLVADLIRGRSVQDALDLLKFANKRAAVMIDKVLRSAIANADEQLFSRDKFGASVSIYNIRKKPD